MSADRVAVDDRVNPNAVVVKLPVVFVAYDYDGDSIWTDIHASEAVVQQCSRKREEDSTIDGRAWQLRNRRCDWLTKLFTYSPEKTIILYILMYELSFSLCHSRISTLSPLFAIPM